MKKNTRAKILKDLSQLFDGRKDFTLHIMITKEYMM